MASDREQLALRYAELSPKSRRSRFGSAPDELSEQRLDQLIDVDSSDRVALAAIAIDEPGQPGIGVARFARDPHEPAEAEAAVVVLDAYQRRGIGSILLQDLVEVALDRGIDTFTGTVLWESAELLDALRALGASVHPAEPGVANVRIELTDATRMLHRLTGS
ncbi:MAG: N-acetyltransferase family protein [Ilumatobacteraceae bacterium]